MILLATGGAARPAALLAAAACPPGLTLQPFDIVVLPKPGIAVLGDRRDQALFDILPPLKNGSFGFVHDLSSSNSIIRQESP